MLHLFGNPIGKTEHTIVHEQLALMRAAEELGFDSVWPAEHHFSEYGDCASPALSLAAIARETKTLRLGTGVVVLPLNHPLQVTEDSTMLVLLDLLSCPTTELSGEPLLMIRDRVEKSLRDGPPAPSGMLGGAGHLHCEMPKGLL